MEHLSHSDWGRCLLPSPVPSNKAVNMLLAPSSSPGQLKAAPWKTLAASFLGLTHMEHEQRQGFFSPMTEMSSGVSLDLGQTLNMKTQQRSLTTIWSA